MPRQADHEQRRRLIAEAVWRLAATRGLEDVTIRQVAAEAGVPARQLQYYFGTRDDLLLGALALLNADAEREARDRVEALGPAPAARDIVRSVLLELLPLDEPRRRRHLVHAAYFVRFLQDNSAVRDTPPELENLVAALLPPETPGRVDEAYLLVAVAAGLQGQMLLGQLEPDRALALLEHQLDRVLSPPTGSG